MSPALPKHIVVICKNRINLTNSKGWDKNNKSKTQKGRAG